MRRTTIITVTLAATALLATACNSGTTGTGTTTTSDAATSSADLHGAPPVSNPIDITFYKTHQCNVLTSAQLQALHFGTNAKQETADQNINGPSCNWSSISDTTASSATFSMPTTGQGLSAIYAQRSTLPLFQPIADINGYPALIFGLTDNRANGECSIGVGVSDQQALVLGVTINDQSKFSTDCDVATQAMTDIVGNIKNGG